MKSTTPATVLCIALLAPFVAAQGTKADYDRFQQLYARTQGKVLNTRLEPRWIDPEHFWYRSEGPGGARRYTLVDAAKGTRAPAFDHAKLAAALSKITGKAVDAARLPVDDISLDGPAVKIASLGKFYRIEPGDHTLQETQRFETPKPPQDSRGRSGEARSTGDGPNNPRSPDGNLEVIFRDGNVFLREIASKAETPLTTDGNTDDSYGGPVYWSPDSTRVVTLRTRKGEERKVYYVESTPADQFQPKLHSYTYPKPGDKLPVARPKLFDVAAKKQIAVGEALFPNAWSIERIRWDADSARFIFCYNQRGHQVLRIIAVDRAGAARPIIDEQSKTFIHYSGKFFYRYLEKSREMIWMSEGDGWNHLYLIDSDTGKVKQQITRGAWLVRGVDRIDEENRQIHFRAGGIRPEQDPYHVHYARVNFDGSGLTLLTEGDGTHTIAYSPDQRYFVDTWSRVDLPPVHELRRSADGKLIASLEKADAAELLRSGWQMPERFVAKGRDGKTDIWGVIYRPTNFDPKQKCPVIESIYAGPHGSHVPKSFRSFHYTQAMAELGFILVQIDGMGTSNRSKPFHDVCWKNLGDAGFPDRVAWIKAAASTRPFMDIGRVGIFGGSAGGQNAMRALIAHGDFYKAAVADCGCHDNRMDKVWWNEQWMGYPVDKSYEESSNSAQAHRMQGKLMLVVGEKDQNVDPASTMQVVHAMIKANKDFDLLVIPGAGHGACETPYGQRRRADFFVRHLLGVEPRR